MFRAPVDAYDLSRSGKGRLDAAGMTALLGDGVARYPIVSIEDGLADDDWDGFRAHTAALGATVQVIGDDI
jgi:enolase